MTIQGKITGVRTVGVPVTDQDRALDFYVGTLGLEKRLDADTGGGRRWIEVAPAGAATSIALVRARGPARRGRDRHQVREPGRRRRARWVARQRRRRRRGLALGRRPADVRLPRPRRQRHGDRRTAVAPAPGPAPRAADQRRAGPPSVAGGGGRGPGRRGPPAGGAGGGGRGVPRVLVVRRDRRG